MRIAIVTPTKTASRTGNRITANRWARLLRSLGHRVSVFTEYDGGRFDVLIALHAVKSARSIFQFRRDFPKGLIVLALTGTDVYGNVRSPSATRSLELADRIVVLQPLAIARLQQRHRRKATVIYQSVEATTTSPARCHRSFRIIVVGHLRAVKDPFRTAMAVRSLPKSSRIEVLHFGAALTDAMRRRALQEQHRNARYRWIGERPRYVVKKKLAESDLFVLTSRQEGGANVVGEAIVMGTPVISSRIAGSIGLLGARYPGYFPVGDTRALTDLLLRAEMESAFYNRLQTACLSLVPLFDRRRERESWKKLLSTA